jgi:hypothetical protein
MICEECSCLFIEQTVSYDGTYVPKQKFLNSEFNDNVLLFLVVILILQTPNVLLISVT